MPICVIIPGLICFNSFQFWLVIKTCIDAQTHQDHNSSVKINMGKGKAANGVEARAFLETPK